MLANDNVSMSVGHLDHVLIVYSLMEHFLLSFFSFFLIIGDTRFLRMPALRPASQAGPMRNPREGTSVVLRDTTRLT